MCNIIVYLAVDKDGQETFFPEPPQRNKKSGFWHMYGYFNVPRGTIKKLTGKDITWESGYIEYVGDNYDPTID